VFEWCCKRSKLVVGMLLKGSKMCLSAAVQGTIWLWDCCSKVSKMCGIAAVQGANWLWCYCCKGSKMSGRGTVQEANFLWDC